jgi:hypothetical protein
MKKGARILAPFFAIHCLQVTVCETPRECRGASRMPRRLARSEFRDAVGRRNERIEQLPLGRIAPALAGETMHGASFGSRRPAFENVGKMGEETTPHDFVCAATPSRRSCRVRYYGRHGSSPFMDVTEPWSFHSDARGRDFSPGEVKIQVCGDSDCTSQILLFPCPIRTSRSDSGPKRI